MKDFYSFLYLFTRGSILENIIDHAVKIIRTVKNNLRVSSLAEKIHICPRHFRRKVYVHSCLGCKLLS